MFEKEQFPILWRETVLFTLWIKVSKGVIIIYSQIAQNHQSAPDSESNIFYMF